MDALLPDDIAETAENTGVKKANMPAMKTFMLAVLAGAFIAFGAIFAITVTSGSALPYGLTKLVSGLCFSLGLILVILSGAELFTGNNLVIMAWANKRIGFKKLMRNWAIVYLGNLFGALSIVVLMFFSEQYTFNEGAVGLNALRIAEAKCSIGFVQGIALGILCNILVCLAVWLCFSAKSVSGKILAIIFPITAFVAAGFEHSVANMYFIPKGLFLKSFAGDKFWNSIESSPDSFQHLNWENFLVVNLLPVTIGNIIGGAFMVGLVYWFIYLRDKRVS